MGLERCQQPSLGLRVSYHSLSGSESWQAFPIWSALSLLTTSPFFHGLAFSLWLTPPPSPKTEWELSKTACVIMRSSPSSPSSPLALFTPTLLFPSSIHPSPWKGWGMHGCIPGLMKLILQECSPMWLLERHRQKTKGCLFKWGATKDHWGVSMCWGEDKKRKKKKRSGTRGGEVLKWIAPLNRRAGWETVTFPD